MWHGWQGTTLRDCVEGSTFVLSSGCCRLTQRCWLSHIPFRSQGGSSKFPGWKNPVPCSCRSGAPVRLLALHRSGLLTAPHSSFPAWPFISPGHLGLWISLTLGGAQPLLRAHPIHSGATQLSDLGSTQPELMSKLIIGVISHHIHGSCALSRGKDYIELTHSLGELWGPCKNPAYHTANYR